MESMKRPFSDLSETERQRVAEALWNREKPRCQSALVDGLLRAETLDGFGIDDIDGLYVDPSDWDIAECREWLDDNAAMHHSYPSACAGSNSPWKMDRADIIAELEGEYGTACYSDESTEELADALAENRSGEDAWREAVTEHAEPAEPFEWWEVGSWLAEKLSEAGEVTLCNDYGHWWGRCCTGQSVTIDHVIQKLGHEFAYWALDRD